MEVIEFCKMAIQTIINGNDIPLLPETKGYFERIISLLKQEKENKKYEKMWEELKKVDRYASCPASRAYLIDYREIERLEEKYLKGGVL